LVKVSAGSWAVKSAAIDIELGKTECCTPLNFKVFFDDGWLDRYYDQPQ
jgi:hypothetical protein